MKKKLTLLRAFDLFSGIGGFRAGCLLSSPMPIEFVGSCEIDLRATIVYDRMFKSSGEYHLDDIWTLTRLPGESHVGPIPYRPQRDRKIRSTLPPFDILFAGFPCQSHSLMGNRRGHEDRSGSLFYDIAAILKAVKPQYFVLENVRAIKSVNGGALYRNILNTLSQELGYNLAVWELNAADYGTPQIRRRIFFVGAHGELPVHAPPTLELSKLTYPTTWHLLEREVTPKYYLTERILRTILKHEHKGYRRKAEINRLVARPLTRTMHKMHRASQDNYYSDAFIQGHYDERTGEVVLKDIARNRIRRLTPREAFRIQSFPESMIENALESGVSDTQLYMQAGNAVAPVLVNAVVNHCIVRKGK